MTAHTAITADPLFTADEARRIAAIAQAEIERQRAVNSAWSLPAWAIPPDIQDARRDRLADLREIRCAAISVQDDLAGFEGFENAPSELAILLTEWAETVDHRTFGEAAR